MTNALSLLKARLGITIDKRDVYLQAIIEGVKREVKDIQGLDLDESNPNHLMFLVDYSCWRYMNKGEDKPMPQHILFRLKNLMVGGKNGNI